MADVATLELGSAKKFGTTSGSTLTDDGENTWTINSSNSGSIQNSYSTGYHGQQIGTSKSAWTGSFTANIEDVTISSVKIDANTGGAATVSVTVGSTTFQCNGNSSASITKKSTANAATWYEFTGSASGQITITVTGTSAAFYFGGVVVTYSSASTSGQTLYFKPNNTFADAGAKCALYYFGHATESPAFTDFMTLAENETDVYTGVIPEGYTKVIVVRYASYRTDAPDWDNTWGQTVDITLESGKDFITINSNTRDGEGKWSDISLSKYVYVEPCTPNFGFMVGENYVEGTWKEATKEWMVEGLYLEEGQVLKMYNKCEEASFAPRQGNFEESFDLDGDELTVNETAVYDLYITLNAGNDKLRVVKHSL